MNEYECRGDCSKTGVLAAVEIERRKGGGGKMEGETEEAKHSLVRVG